MKNEQLLLNEDELNISIIQPQKTDSTSLIPINQTFLQLPDLFEKSHKPALS